MPDESPVEPFERVSTVIPHALAACGDVVEGKRPKITEDAPPQIRCPEHGWQSFGLPLGYDEQGRPMFGYDA